MFIRLSTPSFQLRHKSGYIANTIEIIQFPSIKVSIVRIIRHIKIRYFTKVDSKSFQLTPICSIGNVFFINTLLILM